MLGTQESKFPRGCLGTVPITLCALLAGGGATASQAQRSGASDAVPPESRLRTMRLEREELGPGGPVKYKRAFDDATSNPPTEPARPRQPTTTSTRHTQSAVNRTVAAGRRLGRPDPPAQTRRPGPQITLKGAQERLARGPKGTQLFIQRQEGPREPRGPAGPSR